MWFPYRYRSCLEQHFVLKTFGPSDLRTFRPSDLPTFRQSAFYKRLATPSLKKMSGSSITCEYSKGQFGTRVEAILQVFDVEIEVKSPSSLRLTFRDIASTGQEAVGSDTNLGRRLHQKIKEMLGNKTTIHSDDTTYFVEVTKAHGCKNLRHLNPIVRNRFKKVKNGQPFHGNSKDACRLTDLCSNTCTNVANARRQPFTP